MRKALPGETRRARPGVGFGGRSRTPPVPHRSFSRLFQSPRTETPAVPPARDTATWQSLSGVGARLEGHAGGNQGAQGQGRGPLHGDRGGPGATARWPPSACLPQPSAAQDIPGGTETPSPASRRRAGPRCQNPPGLHFSLLSPQGISAAGRWLQRPTSPSRAAPAVPAPAATPRPSQGTPWWLQEPVRGVLEFGAPWGAAGAASRQTLGLQATENGAPGGTRVGDPCSALCHVRLTRPGTCSIMG